MAVAVQGLSASSSVQSEELKRAQSFPVRAAAVLFGFGFIWAGAGLWLVPGQDLDPSILLAKMFLSIMMVTAGVGMTQIATDKPRFELHFDGRNRQVLLVQGLSRGRSHIVRSINYEDIGRIQVSDDVLTMYGDTGKILAELPLEGANARLDAIAQLRSQSLAVS
ncbi:MULTISPECIES: hypothetical protein [Shimia]|uniref:hypothetical protein n=1 Tax=Shimia TaxID=573139 RepID=UPI001FB292EE|nr:MULTISPECIES: hypothetical protein [Shimia]MDV4145564.1 hypothetical protein [Shimia sp. FJ5]